MDNGGQVHLDDDAIMVVLKKKRHVPLRCAGSELLDLRERGVQLEGFAITSCIVIIRLFGICCNLHQPCRRFCGKRSGFGTLLHDKTLTIWFEAESRNAQNLSPWITSQKEKTISTLKNSPVKGKIKNHQRKREFHLHT